MPDTPKYVKNAPVILGRVYIAITLFGRTQPGKLFYRSTLFNKTSFPIKIIQTFTIGVSMHSTRKRKKPRKYRGQQMLSDIENLDRMLGANIFDREESEVIILARRPESASCNASDNEKNLHLNTRENKTGISADHGQTSTGMSSSVELNRLSGELNSRISREMDEMMNSVSVPIQRAINDAFSNQVLPQIQSAFKAGSGHVTPKGWAFFGRETGIWCRRLPL